MSPRYPNSRWFHQMRLGGDMGPNMGTTISKTACAINWRKLNSVSYILFKETKDYIGEAHDEPRPARAKGCKVTWEA
ncbi:hypothetical protein E2C01_035017 [Portunus trituberculatus]|uniref:Uncharacterized protein n=1 Tax=Portunus trituberculatus TaxID=210409 RepID=A0A5B7F7A9_PORTR|nr:hypothetical protein [Portunus trituberculatus]